MIRITAKYSMASAVTALALAGAQAGAAEYTFTFAHVLQEDTPNHQAAEAFAEEVHEESDGRIQINISPAAQLGGDVEIIQQLQQNMVQIAIPPTATLGNFEDRVQILDLPYLLPDHDTMVEVLDGDAGRAILDTLHDHNMHAVNFWGAGFRHMTNNVQPIESADDLEGISMRTMEAPIILETYRTWGASPTAMAFTEVYNALQQGVVDGQENPFANIDTMNFYEVQDYLSLTGHAYHGYAAVVNEDAWNQLPDDLQEVMTEAFNNGRDKARELTLEDEEETLNRIESEIEVNELSDDQLDAFIEAAQPVHAEFEDEVTPELLDKVYEVTGQER